MSSSSVNDPQKLPSTPRPPVQYPSAGTRQRPPNRRLSETRRLKWQPPGNVDARSTTIFVTIGYAPDLTTGITADAPCPIEIFYNSGYKSGSDLEVLMADICIILSVFLQHDGIKISSFTKAVSQMVDLRHLPQKSGSPAPVNLVPGSLVGLLLRELQRPPKWAEDVGGDDV